MKSIKEVKNKILPILKKNGVVQAGIFGSVARKENTSKSDVDILIEFQKGKSFFDLVSLERELRIKLVTKVDVLTYDSINHLLKKQILAEEVKIL